MIRPHPRFTFRFNKDTLKDIKVKNKVFFSENLNNFNVTNGGEDIYKDFKNARVAISYSSNSLIEAVCEGVPSISHYLKHHTLGCIVSYIRSIKT
jgi:spore coat polysaccharide biosynthesis predicted glycosyltransferase SpsG